MTANKDSPEVVKFLGLFAKLKDWCEDDPESLSDLADTDEPIKNLCFELLKAAGSIQRNERDNRELFTAPVDSKFVTAWRVFEERYAHALLIVRSNAVEAGGMEPLSFLSFDWYEHPPRWEDADFDAAGAARAIEKMIELAHFPDDENKTWLRMNHNMFPKQMKASVDENRKTLAAADAAHDKLVEDVRNELRSCDDEAHRSALNDLLIESNGLADNEPLPPIESVKEIWRRLKDEVGFDLRGVFRRRELVPFVLFPRHVAAHHGQPDTLSIYEKLRQAHEAFVFGAPFAALALMRSIMEIVLRDHYGAHGANLCERINNSRKLLPSTANASALHRLRMIANSVLHLDTKEDEALPRLEPVQRLETEISLLLRVLRALIEGAPHGQPLQAREVSQKQIVRFHPVSTSQR
jgi:hypothetical protein